MKHFKYKRKLKLFIILLLILIIPLSISALINSHHSPKYNLSNKILVHYIDVGQGDSILVQVNNKNLLIDSGPKTNKRQLLKYLNSLNLDKLDYIIATHPHNDHIGNMADVINSYNVSSFYAPKVQANTKSFEDMIDALKHKNLKINVIKKGTSSIDLGNDTKVSVYSPIEDVYENINNYSPILKIEYKSASFLFVGDAEEEIEKAIIANKENLQADVLKVGHHGSSSSSSAPFLKEVNPSIAIISVGQNNVYNHPNQVTLDNLTKNRATIYRTDIDKNIVLSSDGSSIKRIK